MFNLRRVTDSPPFRQLSKPMVADDPSPTFQPQKNMLAKPSERQYSSLSIRYLIALPLEIVLTIISFLGLFSSSSRIIRITPRRPGRLDNGEDLNDWVLRNVPSLKGPFALSRWLFNGHLQTMYSVIGDFTQVHKVLYIRTYIRVPDGGTLGLDFTPPHHETLPKSSPTIVVCHGLTGGSHESYVRNVLCWAVTPVKEGGLGARAVVINFRGCAGVPITSPQFYSAGATLDLALSLHFLRSRYPNSPLHGIGFSLGASVLSRYLGESSASSILTSGIVIGTPWHLPAMSDVLENHWFISRVYSQAMATNILRMFSAHYDRDPKMYKNGHPALEELNQMRGRGVRLKAVDEHLASKVGGPSGIGLWPFNSADEYYDYASPYKLIHGVKRPLLAINAFDDPIIYRSAIPVDEIQSSSHVFVAVTPGGGHLGWFTDLSSKERWVRKPISEFLSAATRDLSITNALVTVEAINGWEWVKSPAHEVNGVGGEDGRIGWRVLEESELSDDWDKPTIIGYGRTRAAVAKGTELNDARRTGAVLETSAKDRAQTKGPADHQRIAKLDRDDAPKPPEKVDVTVGKALAQARTDKKDAEGKSMTQKELATAVNAKQQDIADLESGKAIPNQQLLGKLERVLGVKLRGAAALIGTPLGGPKKAK
ncbi:MAG: hypothetical protein TREMPRED_001829 [Tremellales sp. Tagirdzhanova-0007]|nr:MAG: hypothetical protein TREMPRED_001829 [Tremellales sp. Tagirdzhanova-0007]